MKKRSITIAGHQTSLTLEEPFWQELRQIAAQKGCSLNQLVTDIDKERTLEVNLSSALRLYVLEALKQRLQ